MKRCMPCFRWLVATSCCTLSLMILSDNAPMASQASAKGSTAVTCVRGGRGGCRHGLALPRGVLPPRGTGLCFGEQPVMLLHTLQYPRSPRRARSAPTHVLGREAPVSPVAPLVTISGPSMQANVAFTGQSAAGASAESPKTPLFLLHRPFPSGGGGSLALAVPRAQEQASPPSAVAGNAGLLHRATSHFQAFLFCP